MRDQNMKKGGRKEQQAKTFTKKPLNNYMLQQTRRTRVKPYRDSLENWTKEEGVLVTQMLRFKVFKNNNKKGKCAECYAKLQNNTSFSFFIDRASVFLQCFVF